MRLPCLPRRWPLALALSLALGLSPGFSAPLPNLGDDTGISLSEERQLGDRVIQELYRESDYLDDPILSGYVQSVWQPLLAAARARGELSPEQDERFAWEILLGRDATINAFALPGGYMGLHLGLIAAVTRSDELASVLAHEMSHITQRHLARMSSQQGRQAPWVMAAMILAVMAASKNPDAASAVLVGGQAAAIQNQLKFSRDMEREADRVGFAVMSDAGFAPQGFVTMFEKLQHAARLNDDSSYPYLRSHPLTTERMADMQARVQDAARKPPGTPDAVALLMGARARAILADGNDALHHLTAQALATAELRALPPEQRASVLYAAALSWARLKDAPRAQQTLQQLQATLVNAPAPVQWQLTLLQADIALQTGQRLDDALRGLLALPTDALQIQRPRTLLLAQADLQQHLAGAAASLIQPWVTEHPRDATAWQILASAWTNQGSQVSAIRADAEAHAAHLDYAGALDRLKAARERLASTPAGSANWVEGSILDARLHDIEALLKAQQKAATP